MIGPDLAVSALSAPGTVSAGASIVVTDTIINTGPGAAGVSTVRFYLSQNTTLDGSDTQLGERPVPALASDETSSGTTSLTIPADTLAGSYFVIARADADDVLVEITESNNVKYSSLIRVAK